VSALPARRLHLVGDQLVDDDTGEIVPREVADLTEQVEKLKTDLRMAQRDVKAKNRRIAEMERDKAQERLNHPRYQDIERIARYWHRKCRGGSGRVNPMSPDRFDAVARILDQERIVVVDGKRTTEPMYSMEECKAAVDGLAFDHFTKPRRNGSVQHFDDLELAFRDSKHFEEFRDKAPRS
jgi:hypothetical protein